MFDSKKSEKTLRREGDHARDQGEWVAAAEHYRAYLAVKPDDAAIWVQLGHALKEQGLHSMAEEAYRKALTLLPEDADGYLQLGHVLKLQGRTSEAREAYSRSLELMPSQTAHGELVALGGQDLANSTLDASLANILPNTDLVMFEIDDLLGYLRAHKTLSGIQRVQVGIVSNVLAKRADPRGMQYAFVRTRQDGGGFWQLRPADLNAVIAHATGAHVEQSMLIRLLDRAEQNAILIRPAAGQTYVILGAFWGFNGDATRYARLKSAGITVGVYIYDLIPLTHPEYCDAHLVSDFALSLGDGLAVFDFILTISEYTAQEVMRMQRRHKLRPVPVKAVPLAHVLKGDVAPVSKPTWTGGIAALRDRPFVLMVSTIEGRKNHAYLVSAWKIFLEEELDPPDLVFVGRYGWRVNDFMEQLKASDFLGGRIHVLHDLSDGELETLYRNCLFTAFPSFVEGWGLPVGESLAYGCPCVASGTTSVPEVGGSLVDYIDPYNLRAGVEVLRKMAFDTDYRTMRREQIARDFKVRTWGEVANDMLDKVATLSRVDTVTQFAPLLMPGELFMPGDLRLGHTIPINYPARPLRPILMESWYPAEGFGVWMRGTHGVLRFRTEYAQNCEIILYLNIAGAPWSVGQRLRIKVGPSRNASPAADYPRSVAKSGSTHAIASNRAFVCRELGIVGADGIVEVDFMVIGESPIPESELRHFFIGLVSMVYCARSDMSMRSDITEALMLEGTARH